jgi:iron complex outermembrane receptor protein
VSQYGTDLSGQPTGEPSWSFSANLDYTISLDDSGAIDVFLVHSHRGAIRCNDDAVATKTCLPQAPFPLGVAQNITDGRIAWHSRDHRWGVSVYGTNLFNNRYVTGINGITAATFGTPIASVNAPLRYGIDLHAAF